MTRPTITAREKSGKPLSNRRSKTRACPASCRPSFPCTVPIAAQVIVGQASAIIYSLVETAKENRLAYRYLTRLMREAPKLDLGEEEQIAGLLPANAPEKCRVIKGV